MSTSDSSRTGTERTRRHVTKAAALVWLALLDRALRPAEALARPTPEELGGTPRRAERCDCCRHCQRAAQPAPDDQVEVHGLREDEDVEARYRRQTCSCCDTGTADGIAGRTSDRCGTCRQPGKRIDDKQVRPRDATSSEQRGDCCCCDDGVDVRTDERMSDRQARKPDDCCCCCCDCESDAQRELPQPPYQRVGRVPCFLPDTWIRTVTGFRPIEDLAPGDVLPTMFGGDRPIRRIRRTRLERPHDGVPWPVHARPIRIAASALADTVPAADLVLTAAHALLIDGCLVTAGDLVNGTTIVPHEPAGLDVLELFHIELDGHDVIDAEGCPCESLLMPAQQPCAPRLGFDGRRREVASRLRSALAPWLDRRQPLDIIRDRIEARGEGL